MPTKKNKPAATKATTKTAKAKTTTEKPQKSAPCSLKGLRD